MHSFRFQARQWSDSAKIAFSAILVACIGIPACGFDWDSYDPRLGPGGGTSSGMAGSGGMASSSSSGDMGGAGGMGGSGGGSGGGTVDVCGKVDLLSENFDAPLDTTWLWDTYADPTITIGVDQGQFAFQLSATSTSGDYASAISNRMYDLRDSAIVIEVISVPNAATQAQAAVSFVYDANTEIGMHCIQGKIQAGYSANGSWTQKSGFTHDSTTRFWRIREEAGYIYWETAPDGMNWTIRSQAPTNSMLPETLGFVNLAAYVPANTANPGEIRFDNLHGEASGKPHWCAASSLQDDFEDNTVGQAWSRSRNENGCSYFETNGHMVIRPSKFAYDRCGYKTGAAFDLTSSSILVEIAQMVDTGPTATADMRMELVCRDGSLQITQSSGKLSSAYKMQGNNLELGNITYDPAKHHWWRIREQGGTIYWEVSGDGKTWTQTGMKGNPFPITECDVYMSSGTSGDNNSPGEAHFDHFNLPP